MKTVRIILFTLAGFFAVMVAISLVMTIGMGETKKLVIRDVDLSKISDGVYEGSYHKGRWTYDARVTVRDHRITDVANTNRNMEKAAVINKKIEDEIIKKQSTRIDVVSRATVNTRAFQKAVENALESVAKK